MRINHRTCKMMLSKPMFATMEIKMENSTIELTAFNPWIGWCCDSFYPHPIFTKANVVKYCSDA